MQSTFVLLAATVIWLVSVVLGFRRRSHFPPGPKGLPIIGNMLMRDQLTHRGLAKLSKEYGGIFHLKMGSVHIVVISSPEMARQVLQIHDTVCSNRPATRTISYLTYNRADMAFAHYGPFWRQMRKICVVQLFSRKRSESWETVRGEVQSMVKMVARNAGEKINLGELIFTLTMNITYRAAFGSKNEGQEEFISIMQEFSRLFGAFNFADFIPLLRWTDPLRFNVRMVKARNSLDKFIDQIIDDHIQGGRNSGNVEQDMVDALLAFYSEMEEHKANESEDMQKSLKLNRANIKAIIMVTLATHFLLSDCKIEAILFLKDVMFGGTETVASAIEWAMAELMRNPQEMKRVQEELEEVVGTERHLEETDVEKLKFLKCVIKETLRLHPPIPLLLHETAEKVAVSEYVIPRGCRVMVNAWAIGRDAEAWEDPGAFRPGRFLQVGAPDFKGNDFEFIPFGSGRRSCPGMGLGLYGLELGVANLLHCFDWKLPEEMKPSDMDMSDVFGLTAPLAHRLVAVPSPRLACPI